MADSDSEILSQSDTEAGLGLEEQENCEQSGQHLVWPAGYWQQNYTLQPVRPELDFSRLNCVS